MRGTQYSLSLPLSNKNSTIDAIVNEVGLTGLHFKVLKNVALRAGITNAIRYDFAGSFSKQYRRELRAALKYEVRYGC